jgi:hypothetical protein
LQEILEGSRAAGSVAVANGADIGIYSSSFFFWASIRVQA